ncbi:Sensor protein kinase WalK [Luteitalea pratensis]|uniref:histidine kinase n=1 Tax=Luteitalea pratensis TaxID=1855912 RepID=A0A143PKL8_LUTPR|nr:ATP-binding protein [Luteitalea pratensis]AMY09031.1 Sensor protein kinase WalK [Luteitalea pratensis]
MRHAAGVTLWALLLIGPALGLAATMLLRGAPAYGPASLTLLAIVVTWSAYALYMLRRAVVAPLRTTSALLQGLREGNFSVRARADIADDDVGVLLHEFNALAAWLQTQRLTEVEASALLTTVMSELESAVLAFDDRHVLRLANPAAARLFARPVESVLGMTAEELGCEPLLQSSEPGLVSLDTPGASGRWDVRHSSFRQDGLAHHLLVLNEVSRALREEERLAWRRLIRVLSHELNNSLTPITSIANSLARFVERADMDDGSRADVRRGLGVIESRAESLNRFLRGYATLAKLPPPTIQDVAIGPVVERVAALQPSPLLEVVPGPDVVVRADPDQLEQLLINLVRNALDASHESGGLAQVQWHVENTGDVEVRILDRGRGVTAGADVFVPFFTTKPGGTGIGLALCRQIADAHGWHVSLENRANGPGCVARLRLPATRLAST